MQSFSSSSVFFTKTRIITTEDCLTKTHQVAAAQQKVNATDAEAKTPNTHTLLKKFPIQELDEKSLTDYRAFLVGNAPTIPDDQLEKYRAKQGKTVMIGISCMRVVKLACQLGNLDSIPLIILVDNSKYVHFIWHNIKKILAECQNEKDFNAALLFFLKKNPHSYHHASDEFFDTLSDLAVYEKQDISTFFYDLFTKYGFQYIQKIFAEALLFKQSFGDKNTFIQIKNIITALAIPRSNCFIYVSNLAPLLLAQNQTREMNQMLLNIQHINPCLAIHANLIITGLSNEGIDADPTKTFLIENHEPAFIKTQDIFCRKTAVIDSFVHFSAHTPVRVFRFHDADYLSILPLQSLLPMLKKADVVEILLANLIDNNSIISLVDNEEALKGLAEPFDPENNGARMKTLK